MRCLGVDPGGTTGMAVIQYEPGRGYTLEVHGGITLDQAGTVRTLRPFLSASTPLAVERFVVSRRAGRSQSAHAGEKARNIIGELLGLVQAIGQGCRAHQATASEAKRWGTDKRLSAAGFVFTNGRPHSKDAARHALYTLVKHYGCPDPLGAQYKNEVAQQRLAAAYRKDTDQCRPDTQ